MGSRFKGIESKTKARLRRELASKLTEAAQEFQRRQKLKKREKEHLHGDLPKDHKPVVSDAYLVDRKKFDEWVERKWKYMFPDENKKRPSRFSASEVKDSGKGLLRTIAEAFRFSVARRSDDSPSEKNKDSQEREEQSKPTKKTKRESTSGVESAQEKRSRSSGSDAKENKKASETRRDSKERLHHRLRTERPESKMTKREKDVGQIRVIRSMDDFDRALKRYPEFRYRENFEKEYSRIRQYFESDESRRRHTPKLLSFIEKKELHLAYERDVGHSPEVKIKTMTNVDRLLEKYPHLRRWKNFPESYRRAGVCFDVKDSKSKTQEQLAKTHEVIQQRISDYRSGKEPESVATLRRLEEDRIVKEWAHKRLNEYLQRERRAVGSDIGHVEFHGLSSRTVHEIRSTKLLEVISRYDNESDSLKTLTGIAEELHRESIDTKVSYLELNSGGMNKDKLTSFKEALEANHREIEAALLERLGLSESSRSIRLGVVDSRIYVWTPNKTSDDLINVWADHYFYFKSQDLANIVERVGDRLKLDEGSYPRLQHLNKLIQQMVSDDSASQIRIKSGQSRAMGEVLHLQCDILAVSPRDFEDVIEKVTGKNGRGGIPHPRLLRGKELEILRARLGAVVNSDCWLGEDGQLQYTEANADRIGIVKKQFQSFGNISFTLVPNEANVCFKMLLPRPVGKAFIYWGFTVGDKPIQNERLVESVRNGTLESGRAYLEDLISEDGSFGHYAGFRWSRTIVLNPGSNDAKYKLEPRFMQKEIDFLSGMENVRRDKVRGHIFIPISRIEEQSESEVARTVLSIVETKRSKLLDDEATLAKQLGIEIHIYAENITMYEGTGRISLKWVAKTKSNDDAIRWALLAPPNDPRKSDKVKSWLAERPDDVERVRRQLQKEGSLE